MAESDCKVESDRILRNADDWERYLANMVIEYANRLSREDPRIPVVAVSVFNEQISEGLKKNTAALDNARLRITDTHSEKEFVSYARALNQVVHVLQNALIQQRINREDVDSLIDFGDTVDPHQRQRAINKLNEPEKAAINSLDEAKRNLEIKIKDPGILGVLRLAVASSELYTVTRQREQGGGVTGWQQASFTDIQVPCVKPGKPLGAPFRSR